MLAVDDINLRKGDKASGCTVFVDQETHRILIIVKGTTKDVTKKVMESFPSAPYLSRERQAHMHLQGRNPERSKLQTDFI